MSSWLCSRRITMQQKILELFEKYPIFLPNLFIPNPQSPIQNGQLGIYPQLGILCVSSLLCYNFWGDSKSWRASKSHYWFRSDGNFAELEDFNYWWSFIGGGSAINRATPSSSLRTNNNSKYTFNASRGWRALNGFFLTKIWWIWKYVQLKYEN